MMNYGYLVIDFNSVELGNSATKMPDIFVKLKSNKPVIIRNVSVTGAENAIQSAYCTVVETSNLANYYLTCVVGNYLININVSNTDDVTASAVSINN